MEDDTAFLPLPATLEPISRPSSTSTQASAPQSLPPLPGITSLTSAHSATSSPQLRALNTPPAPTFTGSSPASTAGPGGNIPQCQNCHTSTTPLWRRDEQGAVLCNACGLFLKLHGRPRPISLKTDVIKSRNRVKTMRPDLAKQKKQQQQQNLHAPGDGTNGTDLSIGSNGARGPSQKASNGHGDDSLVSRTGTPGLYNPHLPIYHGVEDGQFQAQSLQGFAVSATSPSRTASPINGDRLDLPQTHEQVMAANASLKTRVSELEVIQELYRGRLEQLEREHAEARQVHEVSEKTEAQLRSQVELAAQAEAALQKDLEESHRRENILKRRLDELEVELKGVKDSLESHENGRAKKPRLASPAKEVDEEAAAADAPTA